MTDDPFDTLLERYQSGTATPAEIADLEKILRTDPAKRRRFVESFLLEVQLHKVCSGILPLPQHAIRPMRNWRRVGIWVAAAAGILLAVGTYLFFKPGQKPLVGPEVVSGQLQRDGVALERITDGERFQVVGDKVAVIRLADGSRAEFEPASEGTIHGGAGQERQVVELAQGGGNFQVVHGGGRFCVETPIGTVTALGTKFSVRIETRGKNKPGAKGKRSLAVAVTEGSVQVDAGGKSYRLSPGKTRLFGDDGEQNNRDDGDQNNNGEQGNQPNGQNGQNGQSNDKRDD